MNIKPIGKKNYGSIPHFKESKLGPGDHYCEISQQNRVVKEAKDKNDLVIVQEKVDGSNVGVCNINGTLYALSRAGYECKTSPYLQHHLFDKWVTKNINRFKFLNDGERVCGEWMAMVHGTKYDLLHEPFVAFDLFDNTNTRYCYHEFLLKVLPNDFVIPRLIHIGHPFAIKKMQKAISISGHGAIDPVEGAVYRLENKGKVLFLGKYVRPDKDNGKYLETVSGNDPVWNIDIASI